MTTNGMNSECKPSDYAKGETVVFARNGEEVERALKYKKTRPRKEGETDWNIIGLPAPYLRPGYAPEKGEIWPELPSNKVGNKVVKEVKKTRKQSLPRKASVLRKFEKQERKERRIMGNRESLDHHTDRTTAQSLNELGSEST